ncbi:MAG: hypothetical protein J5J00_15225 [Deltaproteobacteria bacterium]|nr:hypothetical protein [Deltaproteobacteria bacterium]
MSGYLETVLHTEQLLSEYFIIEGNILSTRTADLYRALDKSRGTHVSLWVMRRPFAPNSPAVRAYISRLSTIQRIEPPVSTVLSYGVDAAGVGFCVFPNLNGFPITTGNIEAAEAERRLTSAAKLIDKLHSNDIVCGDICGNSFWVERTGEIRFIGVMGGSDREFVGDALLPPRDSLNYLAPEQVAGQQPNFATDVFAIGVLGYHLLTSKYPFALPDGTTENGSLIAPLYGEIEPVSRLQVNAPMWADKVFSQALCMLPADRYASAGAVVNAISQIRESAYAAERTPVRLHHEGRLVKKGETLPKVQPAAKKEARAAAPRDTSKLLIKATLVIVAVFMLSFLVFRELLGKRDSQPLVELPDSVRKDSNLGTIVEEISRDGNSAEKEKYYRDLVASDDPLSHDILIQAARGTSDDKERARVEMALLDRGRRLGLRRSVEVVRPWLRSVRGSNLPDSYEATLRALDVTLPMEARNASLRQAYANNPRVILRLTAALGLDTGKFGEYQQVLAQLVGDATGEDLSARSLPAIVLYSTELVASFGDDIIQRKEEIPDHDVPWLLNVLSKRNDIYVRPIASLAVERKLLPPVKQQYLSFIRDREDLPTDILNTLVKAAAGVVAGEDVAPLGSWLDRSAEDILILILGDQFELPVKLEAFDILAGKNFTREPTSTLVKWVRAKYWDDRSKFIEPIGVLSNLPLYSDEEIIAAVASFEPYMKNPVILDSLVSTDEPLLVKTIIEKYPSKIGLGKRILLLGHPDKRMRMLAIKSLTGLNDVAGLKIILDHFEAEKDPEVKQAYRDNFWVVREREEKMRR